MAVKGKFKTPIVVAIDSGVTSALEGGPFPIRAGARFRADHPAVKAVPDLFVEDGTDDAEIASLRTKLWMATEAASEPPAPVARPERRLRDEDAVVSIYNGLRLDKDDPQVKRNPDWYVPVVPPGLKRRDALIALTSMES